MSVNAKVLIDFCNNNHFSDSEDDTSEEEHDETESKYSNVISQQPINNTITIIVDSSNVEQYGKSEDILEWENIELAELDDLVFDDSFSYVIKEKRCEK